MDADFIVKIVLTPLAALLIPILWNFASVPISYLREQNMQKPIDIDIDLKIGVEDENVQKALANANFKCLIIRYGTDQYIMSMANDQEKYDGRLRNQIIDA